MENFRELNNSNENVDAFFRKGKKLLLRRIAKIKSGYKNPEPIVIKETMNSYDNVRYLAANINVYRERDNSDRILELRDWLANEYLTGVNKTSMRDAVKQLRALATENNASWFEVIEYAVNGSDIVWLKDKARKLKEVFGVSSLAEVESIFDVSKNYTDDEMMEIAIKLDTLPDIMGGANLRVIK